MTEPVEHRAPKRRWRHRIPVRLRHYWRPVALFAVFLAVTMALFGTSRVIPYITGDDRYQPPAVTQDLAGTVSLFDASTSHTVQLTFAQSDYERILRAWYDEGEKEYLEADLVIDGTRVENVGVRLKGNSTLAALRDPDNPDAGRRGPGGMRPPEGFEPPEGFVPPDGEGGPMGGGGFNSIQLTEAEPENLPWLISFDEFAEGRRYQGHTEIAVRPASASSTFAANEALALSLVADTGQTSQDHVYSTFTVNDRPTTTRLLVEHPDESYVEAEFGSDSVLYKSLAGGSFTDKGNDPTEYATDFEQINRIGSQDLQPVIELVRWVNGATDEEFAAQLGEHLDIDSFARYLATQNLLLNFDDMAGPGRNYYLRYDLDTGRFEVVTWDLNFAFGGSTDAGPHDELRMGGFGGGPGGPQGGGDAPAQGAGAQGAGAQGDGAQEAGGGDQHAARGPMTGHVLKERFLATPAFAAVYEQAYRTLYQQIYADGGAMRVLDELAAGVPTSDTLDAATIAADIDTLRQTVTARTAALAQDPVVTGSAP